MSMPCPSQKKLIFKIRHLTRNVRQVSYECRMCVSIGLVSCTRTPLKLGVLMLHRSEPMVDSPVEKELSVVGEERYDLDLPIANTLR